jgi:hypothetical protein
MNFFKRNQKELMPLFFIGVILFSVVLGKILKHSEFLQNIMVFISSILFPVITLLLVWVVYWLTKEQLIMLKENKWNVFKTEISFDEIVFVPSVIKLLCYIFIMLLLALDYLIIGTLFHLPHISFDAYREKFVWCVIPETAVVCMLLFYSLLLKPLITIFYKEKELKKEKNL